MARYSSFAITVADPNRGSASAARGARSVLQRASRISIHHETTYADRSTPAADRSVSMRKTLAASGTTAVMIIWHPRHHVWLARYGVDNRSYANVVP